MKRKTKHKKKKMESISNKDKRINNTKPDSLNDSD